jgi:CubicO group peptidase (beta-lactamase class C family)
MRLLAALCAATLLSGCVTVKMPNVDPLFSEYTGDVPGASVIVVRADRVVLRHAYGVANLESHEAATPSTHYRLASVTKQFTAAAVLTLAEQHKLTLDDPVRRWLPSLPPAADGITIKHLLTHTSGLIDYEDVMPEGLTKQLRDADVLRLLEKQTTTYFAPGSQYKYSNSGYALLALIVEAASGKSFADYLHDTLFVPFAMPTSVAHDEELSAVIERAYGYSRDGAGWKRTDQSLTSAVLGDGGIYTSADELVSWIYALERGRFAEASLPKVETGTAGVQYGYGWRISQHGGRRVVSHTGESIGFRNAIVRFPDEHMAIIILTNRNEGEPYDIAMKIADMLLE